MNNIRSEFPEFDASLAAFFLHDVILAASACHITKKPDFTEITGALWIIPGSWHRKLLTAGAVGAGTAAKMRLEFCLAKANSSRRLLSKAVLTWHL